MKIQTFLALLALIASVGCATGQKFALDRVSQVRLGMTTNELVQAMGQEPFTIAPVRANSLGMLAMSPHEDQTLGYMDTGLERWIWWHTSGSVRMTREIASFLVGDGKVLQIPAVIARSEAALEKQTLQATETLKRIVQERQAAQRATSDTARRDAAAEKRRAFVAAHPDLKER